jgi:hypothetical protein
MRPLVLTPKFKRAFRKFVKRNADLQQRIEETLQQMEVDVVTEKHCSPRLSSARFWQISDFSVGISILAILCR